MDSLVEKFPELDPDALEYIISIATDSAMSKDEKAEIITEHISSYVENTTGIENLISKFIDTEMQKALDEEQRRRAEKAKDVGAYIGVLRSSGSAAPVISESAEDSLEDKKIKQHLLRQYDPDDVPRGLASTEVKGKKKGGQQKEESKTTSEDEELILGLGANENKLFKLKQREEMRARSKLEQEEARALKVQQKLKQQGNEIKATNRRK
jgi:hypothetical protein